MGMGITVIIKLHALPVVVASLLFGAMLSVKYFLSRKILAAAHLNYVLLSIKLPRKKAAAHYHKRSISIPVGILVLFVASGTGAFGAMQEGITGDISILLTKSFLDILTAGIFATLLGLRSRLSRSRNLSSR